jgi:predicted O-linked N-acetylglucosamine transferase (SPINDLY family)
METKLLKSQVQGLLLLEQRANEQISSYLRQCAEDIGLDPEKVRFDRKDLSFYETDGAKPQ